MRILCLLSAVLVTAGAGCAREITGHFERTVEVTGPAVLDVITDSGGISVTRGKAGVVEIRAILRANANHEGVEQRIRALEQKPPIEQSGNTVKIGYVHEKNLLRHVSVRYEIAAPPDAQVRARADSGGIRVSGIQGPADCQADSGGIDIEDIGSEVRAAADSGGIHIRGVRGPVVAHADSGGVEVVNIEGSVEVGTDSGGVEVVQTQAAPIHVRADSGGARVKLASSAGYDLNVRSGSGRITVPEMTVRGASSREHVQGKVRGGGPLVDVQVDSGNIHID